MRKFEFLLSLVLRVVILIWSIEEVIIAEDWGNVINGIAFFCVAVVMAFSLFAHIYILYKTPAKYRENEYEW